VLGKLENREGVLAVQAKGCAKVFKVRLLVALPQGAEREPQLGLDVGRSLKERVSDRTLQAYFDDQSIVMLARTF